MATERIKTAEAQAGANQNVPDAPVGTPETFDVHIKLMFDLLAIAYKSEITRVAMGDPFVGSLEGPAFESLKAAMEEAFGRELTTEGQGGSIPLCNVLAETYPDAEIFLMGVEEPKCLIHAPNESVDPSEIEHLALAEALFLERYAEAKR